MAKGKPTIGRPRVEVDFAMLERLCQIQCTMKECASVLGVSESTLQRRIMDEFSEGFPEFYERHSDYGKMSLRRAQFESALGVKAQKATSTTPATKARLPNAIMQIFLGKQILGQRDHLEAVVLDEEGKTPKFRVSVPGLRVVE